MRRIFPAVILAMMIGLVLAACAAREPAEVPEAAAVADMTYDSMLFDHDRLLYLNIVMPADRWQDMLDTAGSEEFYRCDLEVNGIRFTNLGIRPKGNSSLSSIAGSGTTDRFSFKLKFGAFVPGQTCYGLDKLVLNNSFSDYTYMKEAMVYDMYAALGADGPLYNFAPLYVNGEYWGLYLALEAIDESFLQRVYGPDYGALYKPDNLQMGARNDAASPDPQASAEMADRATREMQDALARGEMPSPEPGGMSGGGGSDLNYIGDSLADYSAIWDGAVTKTTRKDHIAVVRAMKNLSRGGYLEPWLDVDNILRYMAVHVFAVNEDSLTGKMAHNYYLYEQDGRLNLLPWDYNQTLGGMSGGDAAAVINDPIDTAFSLTGFFDPLLDDEGYHARYHARLRELVEGYVFGGGFDAFYAHTRERIDPFVESDPTAFCTYEQYDEAAKLLRTVVALRGQSILGQLDGTIPATDEGQAADPASRVSADGISMSVMGGGRMGGPSREPGR